MKKFICVILASMSLIGYGQEITLQKIYSGYYRGNNISNIISMNDGERYTVLHQDGVYQYSYKTGDMLGIIAMGAFENYTFSADEKLILLQKESQGIYRHSFLGKFEIKDLQTDEVISVNNGNWIQEPLFSPNGAFLAFIFENNLYYQEIKSGKITQVTFDGQKNKMINGLADWVYEEEFGHARQYEWNNASDAIVFVKSDEAQVREMNMQIFQQNLYPKDFRFKYPKAGEENSKVSLHSYHLKTKQEREIDLSHTENYYIPKLFQTKTADEVVVLTSNRHQNKVDVLKLNTTSNTVQKLFSETDTAWIETDNFILEFLGDNSFLWASERDGFRHLYWYTPSGKLKKQVTKGKKEITNFYGFDPNTKEVFVQMTDSKGINRLIAKVNINTGKEKIISDEQGSHDADFSKSFKFFINTYSNVERPHRFVLKDAKGNEIRELQNNEELLQKLKADGFVSKEFFTIPNEVGDEMNAWMLKPKHFDPNKKYPLFMFQYSGPGSQQVSNSWDFGNTIWFNHLAQQGYVVVCVDGRGTGYRGAKFKKSIYKNLGKYEIADQIAAARWLGNQTFIDKNRIGIFGWSFGGYMSTLAMTKGAEVFKMGIAVAPVTSWRYYDTIYTERFLQTPQENPEGYDENSPINFVHLLKGKYLLIHGTADDNVHYQNALELSEALIQKNKPFEFMTYPDKNHGIYGGRTRHHLYQKMTDFILQNL